MMRFPIKREHMQFKHPFTCMVAGPTSSGKTYLVRNILENFKNTINFEKCPSNLRVLWAYGQWQDLYTEPIEANDVNYVDGLPDSSEIDTFNPHLIIIDDLMTEAANDKCLTNLFTKGSHHKNLSVIFITQNIFHQGREMRSVSLNCHYMVILKNPRDQGQIVTLATQVYRKNPKFLIEAYNDATKEQHGYIRIDLKQNTPEKYRYQTRILPINNILSPIAYVPRT